MLHPPPPADSIFALGSLVRVPSSLDTLKSRSVLSNPAPVLKSDLELSRNLVGG